MAPAQFPCSQCIVVDDSGIESHISAAHLNYFPFECSWCKETDQKYLAATKKHMTQHMAIYHNGKNSRYSVSEDDAKEVELKTLAMECRHLRRNAAAPQIPLSDLKSAFRVLNVLGAATSTGYAAQNGSDPDDDAIPQQQAECITKIEISDQNEQSVSQSNISSENNEISHPVLPKTEFSVNISIADEIDPLISPSTSTGPAATVETQQFITNPENNAPNAIILTKPEPSNSVSTVPIGLRLQAALSSCVPIDIDANERRRLVQNQPETSTAKKDTGARNPGIRGFRAPQNFLSRGRFGPSDTSIDSSQ
ncbi:hypothetical protein DdX_21228 [Ditylenchus destructor]|uniref:Uncharacterized protein n=1 Tax=Ditylenchus destructor TaxID=166010 RepID=A0AAD4MFW8_9BILA|nr:hypothetical protein DdX_21228 [Ditylenchus destructor]